MKPTAIALTLATVMLSGCATTGTDPITDQNYGGKIDARSGGGHYVTRGASYRCPDWAGTHYRGNLICIQR